jgi:hypothetical protein
VGKQGNCPSKVTIETAGKLVTLVTKVIVATKVTIVTTGTFLTLVTKE